MAASAKKGESVVKTALLCASLLLLSNAASADERPPRYDIDGYCHLGASSPDGFDSAAMAKCLTTEDDAESHLRRLWNSTPEYIQRECDAHARMGGNEDYVQLDICVRDQLKLQLAEPQK